MKKFWKSRTCRIIAIAATLLIVVAVGGMTMARYQGKTGEMVNTFTVGNVDTQIIEIFNQLSNTEYQKEPRVTNTGANDCYVRLMVTVTPVEALDRLSIDYDTEHWTRDEATGWYYYKEELAPGQSTTPLFTTVKVDYNETDKPWIDFDIILYQEAVQAEVIKDGKTVTEMADIWALYDAQ